MDTRAEDFTKRLRQIFNDASMAEIARMLDLPHATIRNYFGGRLPAPDVLIRIAAETNVSLNWLLTGKGEMYAGSARGIDLGKMLDDRINELIDKRLASIGTQRPKTAVRVAARTFDVEDALQRFKDPDRVMNEWFKFENRKYPKDFGVVFFQGWETFTADEKIDAVKDAKKVLDRTLRSRENKRK